MRNLAVCRTFPVQILTLAYENPSVCRRILPSHDNNAAGLAAAAVSVAEAVEVDRDLTFCFGSGLVCVSLIFACIRWCCRFFLLLSSTLSSL